MYESRNHAITRMQKHICLLSQMISMLGSLSRHSIVQEGEITFDVYHTLLSANFLFCSSIHKTNIIILLYGSMYVITK